MENSIHTVRFPDEPDEYREARNELLAAEIELRRQVEAVAAQRRNLPLGGAVSTDYDFEESRYDTEDTRRVRLSQLFEDGKDTLFIYSFMFIPGETGNTFEAACPSCTSIIDALDGQAPHLTQLINVAVCAKAPALQFREHALSRGWRNIRLLSSAETTYNHDYYTEVPSGKQDPMATVFVRRGGRIHHFWSSELYFAEADPGQHPRHVDFIWPLWSVLDRTPAGRDRQWSPSLDYG